MDTQETFARTSTTQMNRENPGMKFCPRCGEMKSASEFRAKPSGATYSYCRPCYLEYAHDYYRGIKRNRINLRLWSTVHQFDKLGTIYKRRHRGRHKDRDDARKQVTKAIMRGDVVPQPCARCRGNGNTEAHHPDYSKPLEVIWLCRECHLAEHRRIRKEQAA